MRMRHEFRRIGAGCLATGLLAASAAAQNTPAQPGRPAPPAQPAPTQTTPAPGQPAASAGQVAELGRQLEKLPTPIDTPKDAKDLARLGFMVADANGDGQISKEEATNAADLLVGGFFFTADANGDGTVTQQEAQQVRETILQQRPGLRILIQRAQNGAAAPKPEDPFRELAGLLDVNNDKQLQAQEVRSAVRTAVEGLFAVSDTNRDSQMSPDEVNAAAIGMAQAAGEAAFQLADTDKNGAVSQQEFQQALTEPTNAVFAAVDANRDGQISADEARQARDILMTQLMPRVPTPRGGTPVPNIQPRQLLPGQAGGQGSSGGN